jgi:GT2 family glycosyltransferase
VVSIIVPARNNGDFTASCLGTILHSLTRLNLNAEFILVDDASEADERILDVFRQHRANAVGHSCKIVRSKKWQHYSGVFSIGLSLATRDVIFFISNDMFVTPTFLEALLLVSALSRDFGIVRGTSNHADSHPEHAVPAPESATTYRELEAFSRSVFASSACRYAEDRVLSGDAILVKRAVVERIGVLDLRFFGFFGDIDYGMRLRQGCVALPRRVRPRETRGPEDRGGELGPAPGHAHAARRGGLPGVPEKVESRIPGDLCGRALDSLF